VGNGRTWFRGEEKGFVFVSWRGHWVMKENVPESDEQKQVIRLKMLKTKNEKKGD
jgi:hypothetical protein